VSSSAKIQVKNPDFNKEQEINILTSTTAVKVVITTTTTA